MGGGGDVVGVGDIHGDAVVRLHPVGCRLSAPKPHLLLDSEGEGQVVVRLSQPLHGHEEHHAGNPVVQVGGEDPASALEGGGVVDRRVPHLHHGFGLFLVPGADVHVEVLQLHLLGLHLALQGHHAFDAVGKPDGSAQHLVGGQAAYRAEAEEAVLVNVGDDQPDGVHVGGKEHLGPLPLLVTEQVAQGVHRALVHIGRGDVTDGLGHRPLLPGGAKAGIQRPQGL